MTIIQFRRSASKRASKSASAVDMGCACWPWPGFATRPVNAPFCAAKKKKHHTNENNYLCLILNNLHGIWLAIVILSSLSTWSTSSSLENKF